MVGQLLMSGIPNLNLLFEDEIGIAVCHNWNGKNIIHSEFYGEPSTDQMRAAKDISAMIDAGFKQKGVETIYTWAETDKQKRYNKFLGFKPTGESVNSSFSRADYPREVFEYKKELI